MTPASNPPQTLTLPPSLRQAAERLAQRDGVSLEQWIVSAIAQKVGAVEAIGEMLAERVQRASPDAFGRWLDRVPDRPPVDGDRLDSTP